MATRPLTLTDDSALALQASRLPGSHVPVPPIKRGWAADANRRDYVLNLAALLANNLRVDFAEDDTAPGTQLQDRVVVHAGVYRLGAVLLSVVETEITGISGNGTYRIYADNNAGAGRVARTNAGGAWPVGEHFKLAEVVKAAGVVTTITDFRGYDAFAKVASVSSPVAIAEGGTGATNASAARTALGLEIGVNVQAFDALLTAIAALTTANNRMPYFTGVDTVAVTDLTAFARALLDDADAATARATLGAGGIAAADADTAALTDSSGGTPGSGTVGAIGVAITDPADTPADADALRDDLVANTIPSIEAELVSLRDAVATLAEYANTLRAELNDLRAKMRSAGSLAV